jgi:hypothetical protein
MSGTRARVSRRTVALAVTVSALVASGGAFAMAAAPPPAHLNNTVGLSAVGPILEDNGFPLWYKDTNGQRMELCVDPGDAMCVIGALPTPGAPVVFPYNFPDEAFYSMADASLATNATGGKALLVTSLEAAFANGAAAPGDQTTFGRIRIRAAGVIDGATYKITHPFGTDTITAAAGAGNLAGAARGINQTQDIGDLVGGSTFEQALGSRPGPFVMWDPAVAPAAPVGYLGDPGVTHAITGSPYKTNFFRMEGPAGSFTGSPDLCANPALGDSPTATDDCIETNQFTIEGKKATRAGVQVTKAVYADEATGHTLDLFAKSEPGQRLVVSGTGIADTDMRGDGNGAYYARVYADGTPPADLKVTNVTDSPNIVDHVAASLFDDKVHVNSAQFDNDTNTLTVDAQSGDGAATLTLAGYKTATAAATGSAGRVLFTVTGVAIPPAEVNVTSTSGGADDDDVVITGTDFRSNDVVASVNTDSTSIAVGQPVTLDGTGSTGTITNYAWAVTQPNGSVLTSSGPSWTFTPTVVGAYSAKLTVTGVGAGNTATDTLGLTVVGSTLPVADAGPDQLNMAPTSTITLDGSASQFVTSYAWSAPLGSGITLAKPDTANPTFTLPASTTAQTYLFTLKVTGPGGVATSTAKVSSDPDDIGVDSASFKRGGNEWRVRGTAQYCSANNTITITWNKPGAASVQLGTITPTLAVGVCSFDYRLKNAPTTARPTTAGTITVTSVMGGQAVPAPTFQLL